jgi:hypothetical protein
MLSRNAQNKNGNQDKDYYAVLIQLNYDQDQQEMAKTFFSALYFELTVNFGFNFSDRVFFRYDSKDALLNLLTAAINVIMLQQKIKKEQVDGIIKHMFIIPIHQFDDAKNLIFRK